MSEFFNHPDFDNHEIVSFVSEPSVGLKAIIAVHSTYLGPSSGGVRMQPYPTSSAAITDVLRLSRGMSYKNALAGLKLGGGKAILFGNPKTEKTPQLMHALGSAIDKLGGIYLAAEDVGMSLTDMENIAKKTPYVFGRDPKLGFGGEPSPMTALGVFLSIEAAAKHKFGSSSLEGIKIGVQGVGAVGGDLAQRLANAGAKLIIADIDADRAKMVASNTKAQIVGVNEIIAQDIDIFAPCALGAIINDDSVNSIKAKIICGAANNQLARPEHAKSLQDLGILYAPDYVVNAGGIINVSYEVGGNYDAAVVENHVRRIPNTLLEILEESDATGLTSAQIADMKAQKAIGR